MAEAGGGRAEAAQLWKQHKDRMKETTGEVALAPFVPGSTGTQGQEELRELTGPCVRHWTREVRCVSQLCVQLLAAPGEKVVCATMCHACFSNIILPFTNDA